MIGTMHHLISRLLAAGLCAALAVAAPTVVLNGQAPPSAAATKPAAAVTPARPAALDPATLQNKVDELLEAHVRMNDFSGSVLLASGGKPLVAKGYGHANREWEIPNTPQTKFRIGSITKQFTSMLIMQLREQGKLRLEDSVCGFVSPCPETWKPVTIHHLLTHTSGIPTYTGLAAWREVNMAPKTVDQIIAFFRDLPLQWTPGAKYAYNNSGYFLLGVVIEKAAGKKYEQALADMILTPLGMKDTGYDWSRTIIPRRASGYSGRGPALANAAALDMQQPYSAGAMYSTVEDLLTWDQALYTEKLLPEAAKKIMWTPVLSNYGYGWQIAEPGPQTFGYRRVAHGGGINGFSAMIVRVPEPRVTAIVLANNDTANAGAIARDLLAIYYGQPYKVPAPRTVANVDPSLFDGYVGKYQLGPNFVVTMTREGDRLMSQATGQGKFELFPESDTTFFAKVTELTVQFVRGADGKVTHFILHQGGREQVAKRIE
jgi:CubicO group peptidase (beta-lactamase class C family)